MCSGRKTQVCQTQNKLETGEKIRYLLNFGIIQENLTNFAGCDFYLQKIYGKKGDNMIIENIKKGILKKRII